MSVRRNSFVIFSAPTSSTKKQESVNVIYFVLCSCCYEHVVRKKPPFLWISRGRQIFDFIDSLKESIGEDQLSCFTFAFDEYSSMEIASQNSVSGRLILAEGFFPLFRSWLSLLSSLPVAAFTYVFIFCRLSGLQYSWEFKSKRRKFCIMYSKPSCEGLW